jgi:cytochrome P450
MLSFLIAAGMSDAELRDELLTLLVAGHETTATALAWTLERVVRHPDVLERLVAEPDGEYLDAVIKETLRLRPVVPAVARKLMVPMEFGGWQLPAGVHIAPSIYLLHRRPDLYPDPQTFNPARFLGVTQPDDPGAAQSGEAGRRAGGRPGTYEWIPFGGGIRRCLGASFALMEMKVVLSTILKTVRLKPAPQVAAESVTRRAVTFAPSRGGRISLTAA